MTPLPGDPYVGRVSEVDVEVRSSETERPGPEWPPAVYAPVERPPSPSPRDGETGADGAGRSERDGGAETATLGARVRSCIGRGGDRREEAKHRPEVTRLFADPDLLELVTAALSKDADEREADIVVGMDPDGFMLGPLVARELGIPFVPARRESPPAPARGSESFPAGEGAGERLSLPTRGIPKGARCYLVDGRVAEGPTLEAVFRRVREGGGVVVGVGVVTDTRDPADPSYMVNADNLFVLTELNTIT